MNPVPMMFGIAGFVFAAFLFVACRLRERVFRLSDDRMLLSGFFACILATALCGVLLYRVVIISPEPIQQCLFGFLGTFFGGMTHLIIPTPEEMEKEGERRKQAKLQAKEQHRN